MPKTREWTGLCVGAWILLSPWLLGFSGATIMMWSNVLAGVALVLVNLWAIFGEGSGSAGRS